MEEETRALPPNQKGKEFPARTERLNEAKVVVSRLDADAAWDSIQSRDLPKELVDYVADRLQETEPHRICQELGITGGKNSKQWKKLAAYFRAGFRYDAEGYLFQQTQKFYSVIQRAREILDDAFENGTPQIIVNQKTGDYEEIRVKGATKELTSFLHAYGEAISTPIRLWKDFGAIGEKSDISTKGVTIFVQNNIPMPTQEEIKAHQEEMQKKMQAIETTGTQVTSVATQMEKKS